MGTGRSEAIVGNVVLALSRLITSFYCFFCQISENMLHSVSVSPKNQKSDV
jgi:hypothetical protein